MTDFLQRLGIDLPIIQAPMAGTSTPALAAAVCEAGALGSIAVGATDSAGAAHMIAETRERTARSFNVNLFCHAPARADPVREAAWIEAVRPRFAAFGAEPPASLREIYTSFVVDDAMLSMLVEMRPAVVSFHFGLPGADRIAALKGMGAVLLATATSIAEARACVAAGIDAVVAQGIEAGGHRGMFDPTMPDECRLPREAAQFFKFAAQTSATLQTGAPSRFLRLVRSGDPPQVDHHNLAEFGASDSLDLAHRVQAIVGLPWLEGLIAVAYKWRVRFSEQAVQWHLANEFLPLSRPEHSRTNREPAAKVDRALELGPCTAEPVKNWSSGGRLALDAV